MKFGETLYQRSVPKWSAYNVKYNELKRLIKQRTSAGSALPISIPSSSTSRWHDLESELYPVIKREHGDVSLFLRTKQGEIDRRLAYLEKQINAALRAVASVDTDKPVTQARKYHKLVKDAESIGDEIESLIRFAAVQKTAFRKILKKYRKWTGSTELQQHLDRDVFSSGALQVDYADYLQRLSKLTRIISTRLQNPMLTGHDTRINGQKKRTLSQSNASTLNDLCSRGPLHFDAALGSVQYGESGGSAYFWVHLEYLEQAEALLHRQMRPQYTEPSSRQSPRPSVVDLTQSQSTARDQTYQAVCDNLQRLVRDESAFKPSQTAVVARWDASTTAVVTLSSLAHNSDSCSTIALKRKHLAGIMSRASGSSEVVPNTQESRKIKEYFSEHRDVKPQAGIISSRKRFSGLNNTKDIGTWAYLDTSIRFTAIDEQNIGTIDEFGDAASSFPHAVLHVRWEFSRMPEIVRLLDDSHVAERVHDFNLETAAIYLTHSDLDRPKWQNLLDTDIRRLPTLMSRRSGWRPGRNMDKGELSVPNSSGPSSNGDSIFSATQGHSSATEIEESPPPPGQSSPEPTEHDKVPTSVKNSKASKKPRVRVVAPPVENSSIRYWNEFDDGDSDTHVEERYAIYVDPDEPSFPGAETFSRVLGSMYDSIRKGRNRVASWLPMANKEQSSQGERSPLLFDRSAREDSNDAAYDSSGDDTDHVGFTSQRKHRKRRTSRLPFAPARKLSRRQQSVESTLFWFYSGLMAVAYLLLVLCGILLSAGKKKKRLEVDAGAVTGIVAAEAAAGIATVLICMRRQQLGPIHWGLFAVNVAVVVTVGIAEMALVLGNSG
jgi:hypothetical protein